MKLSYLGGRSMACLKAMLTGSGHTHHQGGNGVQFILIVRFYKARIGLYGVLSRQRFSYCHHLYAL